MDDEVVEDGVKFYIYENKYYLYEVVKSKDGSYYLYNFNKDNEKLTDICLGNVGDTIINFFNNYYNIINNVMNNFYSFGDADIDYLLNEIIKYVQKEVNYLCAKLLVNEFSNNLKGLFQYKYYIDLYSITKKKLDKIINLDDNPKIKELFNIEDMLRYDFSNRVKDEELLNISPNKLFKVVTDFIFTDLEIDKLFFEHLLNNKKVNILDLTISNSINNIRYEILPNTNNEIFEEFIEVYTIDNLTIFLLFEMLQIQKNNINIKKCDLCGKYFIPEKDSKQRYCDNIYKDNKTCRESAFNETTMKNPIYAEYRKNYKSQHSKMVSNSSVNSKVKERWEKYSEALNMQKQKCYEGEISLEEFKEWIEQHKEWIRENYKY